MRSDPASSPWSIIGGNVATNAGGVCCVKYGVTRDYVLGLEAVVGSGEVGLHAELRPAVIGMHHALKNALDPAGIFNPGKVFGEPDS